MQSKRRYPKVYIPRPLETINNPFRLTAAKCSIISFIFHFQRRVSQRHWASALIMAPESADADLIIMGILCRFITYFSFSSLGCFVNLYKETIFQLHCTLDYSSKINARDWRGLWWLGSESFYKKHFKMFKEPIKTSWFTTFPSLLKHCLQLKQLGSQGLNELWTLLCWSWKNACIPQLHTTFISFHCLWRSKIRGIFVLSISLKSWKITVIFIYTFYNIILQWR